MIEETSINTHLIVTDVHEEYFINWCGKILEAKPLIVKGKPVFIIVGTKGRIEINTADMPYIERCAKRLTQPKGRSAITEDKAYIYILEEDNNQKLLGILTHNHVKTYAQMFDKVGVK